MTYREAYDKLIKHAERYPEFEATQRKLGMAISRPSEQKSEGKVLKLCRN